MIGSLGIAAGIACSPSSSVQSASTAGLPPCPVSFDQVAAASCGVEGQVCTYLYPCPVIAGSATCTCAGGHFACTTPDGGVLDDSSACPVLTTIEKCPQTEEAASGLFCSESGLICYYPSACPSVPGYDSCQCVGGRIDADIPHFECASSCEGIPDGGTVPADGSTPDAKVMDASQPDAPAEAAPPSDGAAE
jgi:hypothetical protein